jgi:aspartate-semialdehyde dehydrogenase
MTRSTKRLALIGADNLLGREIKEVLEAAHRAAHIESFASNGEANFGEEEGEAVYRQAVTPETVGNADAVILAGSPEGSAKALAAVKGLPAPVKIIDCTGTLDQEANARIFAPWIDEALPHEQIVVVAHAAAAALALLLSRLSSYHSIARAVFEIFEPASEQGSVGIAELQQQTTNLLSFKALEKKTYDAQVSFAMLPAYGSDAAISLATIEQRVERHLATILARLIHKGNVVAMPSLRVMQAPVFHGYSISGWIEFEKLAHADEVETALSSSEIDVRTGDQEAPTNVGVAGQSGLTVGDIRVDRNNPRAVWIWAAADNLHIVADGVAAIVGQVNGDAK